MKRNRRQGIFALVKPLDELQYCVPKFSRFHVAGVELQACIYREFLEDCFSSEEGLKVDGFESVILA